jgi:hypothetical protein
MAKTFRKVPTQGVKYSDRKKTFASEQPIKKIVSYNSTKKAANRQANRPDKYEVFNGQKT